MVNILNSNKIDPKQLPQFHYNYLDGKNINIVGGCIIRITDDKTEKSFRFNVDHCYLEPHSNQKTPMFTIMGNGKCPERNGVDLSNYAIISLDEYKRLKSLANETLPSGI